MAARRIDINADAGESFGRWELGRDAELLPLVTTVNIACGFHAGDPANMRKSLRLAREADVAVGAHPGYPDLLGFGRRPLLINDDDAIDYIVYQTGALYGLAASEGVTLTHVKPHGSLYGQVVDSPQMAVRLSKELQNLQKGISLLIADGAGAAAVRDAGLPVVLDAAADLEYDEKGRNIIEPVPAEKSPSRVAEQAVRMAAGEVMTVDGQIVPIAAQSLCVHGDRPNAPEVARAVRERLTAEGFEIRSVFQGNG